MYEFLTGRLNSQGKYIGNFFFKPVKLAESLSIKKDYATLMEQVNSKS